MKLKDIIPNYPLENIEVRTNNPFSEDILFGFCSWTGTDLISEDGDSYYLDEEIVKYEFDKKNKELIYWIKSKWKED